MDHLPLHIGYNLAPHVGRHFVRIFEAEAKANDVRATAERQQRRRFDKCLLPKVQTVQRANELEPRRTSVRAPPV